MSALSLLLKEGQDYIDAEFEPVDEVKNKNMLPQTTGTSVTPINNGIKNASPKKSFLGKHWGKIAGLGALGAVGYGLLHSNQNNNQGYNQNYNNV